jgi:hypothetical protein
MGCFSGGICTWRWHDLRRLRCLRADVRELGAVDALGRFAGTLVKDGDLIVSY